MFIFMSLRARFSAYTRKLYSLFVSTKKYCTKPVSGATAEVNENDDKIPFSRTQCKHFLRKTHRSDSGRQREGDRMWIRLHRTLLWRFVFGEDLLRWSQLSANFIILGQSSELTHVCWRRKVSFFRQTLSAGRQNYVNCSQNCFTPNGVTLRPEKNISRSTFI